MQAIPLVPVPSQNITVQLGGQACQVSVYSKGITRLDMNPFLLLNGYTGVPVKYTNLYVDLFVNNILLLAGVPALNANLIVRSKALGFIGDLAIYDTQGSQDPTYDGLGSRYLLVYIEAADLLAAGLPG